MMTSVLRKHCCVARFGILLITTVLIAGMIGCGPVLQYSLTISSTGGGTVTAPGEGEHIYNEGAVVNLVTEAEGGYRFVSWTGDTDTIDNPDAASANITMNGDYSITANFALAGQAIWDWYDLDAVRDNLSGSYVLMNDLGPATPGYDELASTMANDGKGWQPIGTMSDPFTGTLDGLGHEISGLFINRTDEGGAALFYGLYYGGIIKDIGVVNATVTGYIGVAGLLGINAGMVISCYSSANVTGDGPYVGGLAGWNAGDVNDSFSMGNVNGGQQTGGLVGGNDGAIDDSYSTAAVTGNSSVGGLVGTNGGTVTDSFWDIETSRQGASDGGTGLNTAAMEDLTTYLGAGWQIVGVADADARDVAYIWNIVNGETYPFLSWQ
jgi:hypothetical protein